jgi:hypothetical protein
MKGTTITGPKIDLLYPDPGAVRSRLQQIVESNYRITVDAYTRNGVRID